MNGGTQGDNDPGAAAQPSSGDAPDSNQAPHAEPSTGSDHPELVEKPASSGFSIEEYRRQQQLEKSKPKEAPAPVPVASPTPPAESKSKSFDAKGYLRKAGKMMVFFAVIGGLLLMFAAYMIISTIDRIISAIGQ